MNQLGYSIFTKKTTKPMVTRLEDLDLAEVFND
jgi:hypothetical protein